MQNLVILAVLLLCVSTQNINGETFYITRRPNDQTCPGRLTGDPCLTLQQFMSNVHRIYTPHPISNPNTTILEIQPGYYNLFSSFTVERINALVIRGNATIDCNRQTQYIRNIQSVVISGLTFASCERAIFIENVDQLVVENSTFRQRLQIRNVKDAEIRNTLFIDGTQILFVSESFISIQKCMFENNRMGLLAEHTNVTISGSVFKRNSIPSRYRTTTVYSVFGGAAIYTRQINFARHYH